MNVRLFTLFIIILSVFPAFAQDELPLIDTWEIPLSEGVVISDFIINTDGTTALLKAYDDVRTLVSLWDLQIREKITDLDLDLSGKWLVLMQFSPDGSTFFVLDSAQEGTLFDAHTGEIMHTLDASITTFDFSLDGQRLAYGTPDGVLVVIDTETGDSIAETSVFPSLWDIRYHPLEDKIAVLSKLDENLGFSVSLWDVETDKIAIIDEGTSEYSAVALSFLPDGSALTWLGTTTRYTYDLTQENYPKTITTDLATAQSHQGYYRLSVGFYEDATQRIVYVYPIPNAQTAYAVWNGGAPGVFTAFSPDERFVVSQLFV